MKMIMLRRKVSQREEGFASLVIGLILIVVIGLITVGFAQLSRHEQVQALDSQLSSEAYYAAESGINDAISHILSTNAAQQITPTTPNVDTGNCMGTLPGDPANANIINSADDESYTCIIVNLNPPQLEYGPVNYGTGHTVVVTATNPTTGNPMTNLTLAWGSADGHAKYPALGTKFAPFNTTWNGNANVAKRYPAVIELSITPLKASMTRDELINGDLTAYLYPAAAGPSNVPYTTGEGDIKPGSCAAGNAPYDCSVTVTGITPSPTGQYLIHFYDLYDESNIKITGTDGAGPVDFTGGQAQVDATGRAQDVLKRLAVTIPLGSNNFPNYTIQAQDVCKKIETAPATAKDPNPTTFWDPTAGGQSTTDPCDLDIIN